ncbi:MAG TPA: glycoside hydrolase family 43 protein [Pyrinomonadaceae bacterium]|nr:glycoside hydrolase family 43 protein [Pyrinomonadaceae bacterium]
MSAQGQPHDRARRYLNPVYPFSFPDPFVLKHRGEYWAYCTGFVEPGDLCFGVLHSRDLIDWRAVGGALSRIDNVSTCYWAPEVIYDNNQFYLYYSVGNEERMQIRVAVAAHPAGPFRDSDRVLTGEDFAIDAHVFTDDDGTRYLFYATDFLTHTHVGTGTVYDRLLDPFTLAGEARPVTRARFDWQVYDPARAATGGVRWHTVEGPSVLKRKNKYYQMFSGGNWQNVSYGVSYALTNDLATSDEWRQVADGERVLPILRTIPGKVVGPGHNSVVRGPDNRQLFCVYHRWADDGSARLLAIDPLEWAGERMLVIGPSTTPQFAPPGPSFADYFDGPTGTELGAPWKTRGGSWLLRENEVAQEDASAPLATAAHQTNASSFVAEISLRPLLNNHRLPHGTIGVSLQDANGETLWRFVILPHKERVFVSYRRETEWVEDDLRLPPHFQPDAFHLLRVEADGPVLKCFLDESVTRWHGAIRTEAGAETRRLTLFTERAGASFSGFQLTNGWEDNFTVLTEDFRARGWEDAGGAWQVAGGELQQTDSSAEGARVVRGPAYAAYELIVNARLAPAGDAAGGYEFYPALSPENSGPLLRLERSGDVWALVRRDSPAGEVCALPPSFDPDTYQQFRFRKILDRLMIQWEAEPLGVLSCNPTPARVGLGTHRAAASFEMVRVTEITEETNTPRD